MRFQKRAAAKSIINNIWKAPSCYNTIHYSCQPFTGNTGDESPRIISIAIHRLHDMQSKSFSIHQVAEREKLQGEIEKNYEMLESKMLKEFFLFLDREKHKEWIHWNMLSTTYGFEALAHRHSVLSGDQVDMCSLTYSPFL